MTTSHTRLYGLLGWPVEHSASPQIQTAAFRHLDHDGVYVAFPVEPEVLDRVWRGLLAAGVAGLNVTLPHKQAVYARVDEHTETARATGAVNTVYRGEDGAIIGDNTDVGGLARAMKEGKMRIARRHAVICGAGGAAAAAARTLFEGRVASLTILNRTRHRAEALAERVSDWGLAEVAVGDLDDPSLETAGVVIQATSVGLDGIAMPFNPERLGARAALVDLAYAPGGTPLVRRARRRGIPANDGLPMLVHQAALAVERWTGQRVDPTGLDKMRRAARRRRV